MCLGWEVKVHQRQMRKHNRQIHKFTVLSKRLEDGTKIGYRKLNQSPYLVHGFRLFDKVRCLGQIGFIFGRRSSGYFDVRRLDGVKLSPSISWRKLTLLEREVPMNQLETGRRFLLSEDRGFRAEFL